MDIIQKNLLEQITGLHEVPQGAYSLRINGALHGKNSSENIEIVKKEDKPGIDIYIKPGTKNESVHIPVLLSSTGLKELVYNDFHIGEDCDVTIVAGCGIHNGGNDDSEHSGIHAFYVARNAKLKYVEKHYGSGEGEGKRIMNPTTIIELDENAYMEMDTAQIKGVDDTIRNTKATLAAGATLKVGEKLMTHGSQYAETRFEVDLNGENSGDIQLFGTKAGIKMDPEMHVYTDKGGYLVNMQFAEQKTNLDVGQAFTNEIAHFVSCVKGETECRNPAEDGVTLMKILCAIYRSAETGHEVVL